MRMFKSSQFCRTSANTVRNNRKFPRARVVRAYSATQPFSARAIFPGSAVWRLATGVCIESVHWLSVPAALVVGTLPRGISISPLVEGVSLIRIEHPVHSEHHQQAGFA